MRIAPKSSQQSSKMDPASVQNPEKWVSGVTGELPGETLGPKRRPSEKKTSQKERPPPRELILTPFRHFFRFEPPGHSKRGVREGLQN